MDRGDDVDSGDKGTGRWLGFKTRHYALKRPTERKNGARPGPADVPDFPGTFGVLQAASAAAWGLKPFRATAHCAPKM